MGIQACFLTGVCMAGFPVFSQTFIHPGGLHKQSDLERMRYQVQARVEPWYSSFQTLQSQTLASKNYTVRGNPAWTELMRGGLHASEFEADARAAYLNALMWAVTQDAGHAQKAVQIFNAWKNLTDVEGNGGTFALNAGLYAWLLVEAAEIIQSNYAGWSGADRQQFKNMLVHPGYSSTGVPAPVNDSNGTFYWRIYNGDPGRHGNQDLITWRAMLIMGVFLDNRIMFDRALRYFKGLPHRSDDIPYTSGPSASGTQIDDNIYFTTFNMVRQNSTPDWGYNGVLQHYVWDNGQNQESSRDQQHAFFGMGICQGISEVAWNQGDSVWNSLNNRLLAGFEFVGRYNTSFLQSYPDQTVPWEPTNFYQRTDRTGRWRSKMINPHFESDFVTLSRGDFPGKRPIYEQASAHFTVRMGFTSQALWTLRSRDLAIARSGYENTGFTMDHPGWGALTFRRPALCAGDPIRGFSGGNPIFAMNVIPAAMEAENFDHFTADGEGHAYHDLSPGNAGGQYRTREAVDINATAGGGHHISDLESGEWLSHTVHVPTAGNYAVGIRYAASSSGGGIQFAFNGQSPGPVISVPFGVPHSTDATDWKYFIVDTVALSAGVQNMRILFSGNGNYLLDQTTIAPPGTTSLKSSKRRPGIRHAWKGKSWKLNGKRLMRKN